MSNLVAIILSLLTIHEAERITVYAKHLRNHPLGPIARSEQLAKHLSAASLLSGIRVELLTALAFHESALNHNAVSPSSARGLLQLNPRSSWGKSWRSECQSYKSESRCEFLNVLWGAYALRDALFACNGNEVQAIGFYRTGRCINGPRSRSTSRLSSRIAQKFIQSFPPFLAES